MIQPDGIDPSPLDPEIAAQAEYAAQIPLMIHAARAFVLLASQFDLSQLIITNRRFQQIAPDLYPDLAQDGGMDNLRLQAEFLRAVDQFISQYRKLATPPSD